MKNAWQNPATSDLLDLRVYSSRLLGAEPSLVLHGGGNTSVKIKHKNFFGEVEHYLYVKGSGWDLATIERQGFAAVKMEVLLKMAQLPELSDSDMVKYQKAAMIDPAMPAPSVEAILHALIPHTFVDHTHADAIVCITNSPEGTEVIKTILGKRFLYLPYIMPGFVLARQVAEFTKNVNWKDYDGMVLMHHGIFTFAETAKEAYELMIDAVTKAEKYLEKENAWNVAKSQAGKGLEPLELATLRKNVSTTFGAAVLVREISPEEGRAFSENYSFVEASQGGPLTPDHSINVKRIPAVLKKNQFEDGLADYVRSYESYFEKNKTPGLKMLDPAPRWAIVPGFGAYATGVNLKKLRVVSDIATHSMRTWQRAVQLGSWQALPPKDIFDVEYWELEQAKLKVSGTKPLFEGQVALVTGAASGIGKACVDRLVKDGAVVAALDINPKVKEVFTSSSVLPLVCDVTDAMAIQQCLREVIVQFGGLDLVISNAGTFPPGKNIDEMDKAFWQKVIEVNLNSHQYLIHAATPYLKLGINPAVVVIASKNVKAPGPGAAAYSAAKAGLTQLARVAAMELGPEGIRVNVIHPNAVFDTGIWSEDILKNRAQHYGLSVEQYKSNNILGVEITSHDVAALAAQMCGPVYAKITGAQVAIDGGNDRTL